MGEGFSRQARQIFAQNHCAYFKKILRGMAGIDPAKR
jgi:hypothetical protein